MQFFHIFESKCDDSKFIWSSFEYILLKLLKNNNTNIELSNGTIELSSKLKHEKISMHLHSKGFPFELHKKKSSIKFLKF